MTNMPSGPSSKGVAGLRCLPAEGATACNWPWPGVKKRLAQRAAPDADFSDSAL